MTTTPQAALLSEAIKLANEFRVTMPREVLAIWGAEVQAELRRLDALVAHLTADRDDTANELALRTKHNLALTNERDLLAKLQATQELVQAGSASLLDGCKSIMDSIAVSSSVIEHNKQEPVQAGELLLQGGLTNEQLREAFGEKMPGVVPSDRDLTLFALGIEVGAAELADERRMKKMYFDERNSARDAWRRAADQREEARATLSARKPLPYDLICNAIDLADTESMKGDYMLDYSDCIAVVRTMQALIEINGIGLEVKP